MRFKLTAPLPALAAAAALVVALVASPLLPSSAQQQPQQDEQDVTDGFVMTRGAGFGERPKPRPAPANNSSASASTTPRKQPRIGAASAPKSPKTANNNAAANAPANAKNSVAAKSTNAPVNANTAAPAHHPGDASGEPTTGGPVSASASAVGLGYTILKVGADGSNTVVDPSTSFTSGDKIRVALETNADGYLYIFNAENDRATPQMLHPNAFVDNGSNRIAAHARDFIPTDLRYSFVFDDAAATEHLYIIFSRRPLADVPTGAALVEFCRGKGADDCLWQPAAEQWTRIKAAASAGRVVESRNRDLAAARLQLPPATLSRGIKVKKDEPAPAVVRMNASAASDVLLTKIELVHK